MKIRIIKKKDYPELKKLQKAFDVVGENEKSEICLAVGGDGTFIRAAAEYDGPILPIRSNEEGSIGYYSDVGLEDLDFVISNLKKKNYRVEKLANKIEIRYRNSNYYAVNEVVLSNLLEEVSFKIYELNSGRYEIYPFVMSGDGVLITSVVGSTAYNKSAGGPIILSPDVFCITFLNADGPYKNPIVVDSKRVLEIEITKYKGKLMYDGKEIAIMSPKESFIVRLSNKTLNIVRFDSKRESFGNKLERIIKSRMHK